MKYLFVLIIFSVTFGCSRKQMASFQPSKREIIFAEKESSSNIIVAVVEKSDTSKPEIMVKLDSTQIFSDSSLYKNVSIVTKRIFVKNYDSLGNKVPNYETRGAIAGTITAATFFGGFLANALLPITIPFVVLAMIAALVGGIFGINSVKKVKYKFLPILGIVLGALSTFIFLIIGAIAYIFRNFED